MVKKHPVAAYPGIKKFTVKKCTRTIVRLTCMRTNLFQELRVVRKDNDYVEVRLKEYGGSRFCIRIALHRKTITLLSPDYSWLPDAEDIPVMIANRAEEMLGMRRSTKAVTLTRTVTAIEG